MDDRFALRVGLLHLARQRRSLSRAAWAAARLRLDGVRLETGDARYAHDTLVRFGRAIRLSRARRSHATGHELTPMSFEIPPSFWTRRRVTRALAAIGAVLALLVVLLLLGGPALRELDAGGGTPATGDVRSAAASPLRGRSQQFVAVMPVPTPVPTQKPTATGTGGAGGTTGPGGTGGGSGGGTGSGVGAGAGAGDGPATSTPKPTVMVLSVTVTDASTRLGLPGVCVIYGSVTCATAPITDQNGNATLRLSIGQLWHLQFDRSGYGLQQVDVISDQAGKSMAIALVPTR